jgi:hypothetical protein
MVIYIEARLSRPTAQAHGRRLFSEASGAECR